MSDPQMAMDTSGGTDRVFEDHELNDCRLNHLSIGGTKNPSLPTPLRPSASCSTLVDFGQRATTFRVPSLPKNSAPLSKSYTSSSHLERNGSFYAATTQSTMISEQVNQAAIREQFNVVKNGRLVDEQKLILEGGPVASLIQPELGDFVQPEMSSLVQSNPSNFTQPSPSLPSDLQKRQSLPTQTLPDSPMQTSPLIAMSPLTPDPQKRQSLPGQLRLQPECLPSTSNSGETAALIIKNSIKEDGEKGSTMSCAVCGDTGAVAKHYGVMACLGCKGFFRRALKKADQYECINNDKCKINQFERNSCRSCRFKKCLDAGMDPAAVRPDRDFTGKHQAFRLTSATKRQKTSTPSPQQTKPKEVKKVDKDEVWKKLPVEMRTMIMSLQNIEFKICRGDTQKDASTIYPLRIQTIREAIEDPLKLRGKRTEMRYEPYRMAKTEELHVIVYRRLIAAIDWVECVSEMVGGLCIEDKIVLVKNCFGPLMLFKNASRTAIVTNDEDILCVCNFSYVPRNMANAYTDTYHLDNGLVGRMLDELVAPLRKLQVTETELVCMSAIIVLNPMARDLSEEAADKVADLRNRIQDALFHYVKEVSAAEQSPTTRFGTLLLYLPILTALANNLRENLRFAQTFSTTGGIPLLTSLFGCFPVEPFLDTDKSGTIIRKSVETQTDDPLTQKKKKVAKRRLPQSFTSPAENERPSAREFRLLQPPCSYTLIEMFDDRMNDDGSGQQNGQQGASTGQQQIRQQGASNGQMTPSLHSSAPQLYPQQTHVHTSPGYLQNGHPQQLNNQGHFHFNNNNSFVQHQQHSVDYHNVILNGGPQQLPMHPVQQLPRNPYHTISGYPTAVMNVQYNDYHQVEQGMDAVNGGHKLPHQFSHPNMGV